MPKQMRSLLLSTCFLFGSAAYAEYATIPFSLQPQAQQSQLNPLISAHAKLERLSNHAQWSEGPVVMPDGSVIWSDIVNNRVLQWQAQHGVKTWLFPAQFHNGHAIDQQGRILAASHGKRAIERLEQDGQWRVLVDLYQDKKLNSPNDLILDRDGEIWFTDPTFGILKANEGYGGTPVVGGEYSYRFNSVTQQLTRLNTPEVKTPNGIAFSPDQKTLYLTDSELGHDPKNKKLNANLVAYKIDDQKNLSQAKILASFNTGVPDGIAVDELGNIWVTAGAYIHIVSATGQAIGKIKFPTTVANLVFSVLADGRKVIYIAGATSLYRLEVNIGAAH